MLFMFLSSVIIYPYYIFTNFLGSYIIDFMSKSSLTNKKIQISSRNRLKNRIYKSTIKTLSKKYFDSLNNLNHGSLLSDLSFIYSKIDKAVKKRVLHKNNAARKKSLLARAMKRALKL